ncbi:hypothetical protein [Pedococcus sp. 5OH_020]|uniref:hypothetical protein n=1 Tax=Pedococcus sp. 5OH_020 TaxID=2989814 RepID=UPI0022E9F043|nr:hypothetical protein [Pedococcus sp. 5OH_020]
MSEGGRASSIAALAFSVLPGWLVVTGTALTGWLDERTPWSPAPFGVGGFAAIAILNLGKIALSEFPSSEDVGRIPWFSGVASDIYLSRSYLARRADAARLPASAVIAAAWSPWWVMAGFWVYLVIHAIADFLPL